MQMAWKEMMKYKLRYFILGSIIFLIALLTMIISGLANGLSADNASLIQNMPEGTYYMEESAEERNDFSNIPEAFSSELDEGTLFSIQMGELVDENEQPYSVAFVAADNDYYFPDINEGEIILDHSFQEDDNFEIGDVFTTEMWEGELIVAGFAEQEKYSHSPVGFINSNDYQEMYNTEDFQIAYTEGEGETLEGMQAFDNSEFLNTIPSYSAEQLSLNMITVFLYVISALLFAIFFYMINVQKIATFGILKAIGVKTLSLFVMMWVQMFVITIISLMLAILLSQAFNALAPSSMPFDLNQSTILMTSALFVVIGFAGATISGIQIKRVEPMQAINQGGM